MARFLPFALVLVGILYTSQVQAQLSLVLQTAPRFNGSLPTLVGLEGQAVTSTLVPSGAAVMLYGVASSASIESVCRVSNANSVSATISNTNGGWGLGSIDTELTVGAVSGCDGSGPVQILVSNHDSRNILVDCSLSNSSSTGCDIWYTGTDITQLYTNASALVGASDKAADNLSLGCTAGGNAQVVEAAAAFTQDICTATIEPYLSGFYQTACGIVEAAPQTLVVAVTSTTSSQIVLGCGSEENAEFCECKDNCCNHCFPGDANVQLEDGTLLPMHKLAVGDKVAAWGQDGQIVYDHVYAFGHKDGGVSAPFIKLSVAVPENPAFTRTLELSGGHFVQTATGPDAPVVFKRAMDVVADDYVWALQQDSSAATALYLVKGVSTTWKSGLYNPITLSGSIMIDGVVASVHSEWFLDSAFDAMGMTSKLPSAYQAVLTPARMLWYALGKDNYLKLYSFLDNVLGGLDKVGTKYGASIAGAGTATSAALVGMLVLAFKKAK